MSRTGQGWRKGSAGRWWRSAATAGAVLLLAADIAFAARQGTEAPADSGTLQGRFLVARPSMPDPRFARTVILMVKHDKSGAFGLVINKVAGIAEISGGRRAAEDDAGDWTGAEPPTLQIPAYFGGPVEPHKAFVIHSTDYQIDSTVGVTSTVAVTADPRILKDIADGKGPTKLLYIVGYSGWGAGQLEHELRRNDWYTAPVDDALVFGKANSDAVWRRAVEMRLQGI